MQRLIWLARLSWALLRLPLDIWSLMRLTWWDIDLDPSEVGMPSRFSKN
jgi:hypothetical protein